MCTLIAIHRRVPGHPLVIAANRDEYLDRPAEGPAVRATRVGRVLAPLDLQAGGTWLGLNEQGVFAALTNMPTEHLDPGRVSRGEVVLDALAAGTADESMRRLEGLPTSAYNPFNLFVADERTAHVIAYRDRPDARQLDAGVHVIGNVDATGPGNEKVNRIRGEVETAVAAGRDGLIDRLAAICRQHGDHGPGERERVSNAGHAVDAQETRRGRAAVVESIENRRRLGDTCVHVEGTYGTRSSLILELDEGPLAGRLLHAAEPPCRVPYEDVTSLLEELGRRPEAQSAEALMRTAS